MSVDAADGDVSPPSSHYPRVVESPQDVIVVTISDDLAVGRTSDLWAELEEALEAAVGRLVIVDLTQVTTYAQSTLDALSEVADAIARRRDNLCAVAVPLSPLAKQVGRCGVGAALPVFSSVADAVDGYDAVCSSDWALAV